MRWQLARDLDNRTLFDAIQNGLCFPLFHKAADTHRSGIIRNVEFDHIGIALGKFLVLDKEDFALYCHKTHIQLHILHRHSRMLEGLAINGLSRYGRLFFGL